METKTKGRRLMSKFVLSKHANCPALNPHEIKGSSDCHARLLKLLLAKKQATTSNDPFITNHAPKTQ